MITNFDPTMVEIDYAEEIFWVVNMLDESHDKNGTYHACFDSLMRDYGGNIDLVQAIMDAAVNG